MSFLEYVKDHFITILLYLILLFFHFSLYFMFQINTVIFILSFVVLIGVGCLIFAIDYYRTHRFFKEMNRLNENLDKKYLIHEMLEEPSFYEGKLLYQQLCDTDKAMNDYLNEYRYKLEDFKEYVELWVHEVKLPLATASMIMENNHDKYYDSLMEELRRIDMYVEQALFYVRSENVEKDYSIKEYCLDDVVKKVISSFRRNFILKKITLERINLDINVKTDAKWLEFILGQIIGNSIKYATSQNAYIKIEAVKEDNYVRLDIEDNGIGIAKKDIKRVFEKGFTGENGRKKYNSTGIGLYLCKSLCEKMNHKISIASIENEKTIVRIIFPEYDNMDIMKENLTEM